MGKLISETSLVQCDIDKADCSLGHREVKDVPYKNTDLSRLEVDLVLHDEGFLALGKVERLLQLG